MWEESDPRAPRSLAGTRLRHLDMARSRLAHWPPPQRDVAVKHEPVQPDDAVHVAEPRPARRWWHLKNPLR